MFPVEALHGNAYFAKQAYVFNDISLGIIGATIDWKIVYFLGNAGWRGDQNTAQQQEIPKPEVEGGHQVAFNRVYSTPMCVPLHSPGYSTAKSCAKGMLHVASEKPDHLADLADFWLFVLHSIGQWFETWTHPARVVRGNILVGIGTKETEKRG